VLTVSVVIPVYRAALTLRELYGQLSITMRQIAPTFEIIFVEDCGGDESWSIITELAEADQRVRGIRMSRNYGQHNAVLCGIRAARYDVIVTMDDDLQHPVSEIAPLLAPSRRPWRWPTPTSSGARRRGAGTHAAHSAVRHTRHRHRARAPQEVALCITAKKDALNWDNSAC
jgi:glycosyltransferase involved in cell wall biosynthesis